MKLQAVGALLGAFTTSASVVLGFSQLIPRDVVNKTSGTQAPSIFQQLIDHDEPHLGTFGQRYWFNAQYWAGSGAPVLFLTPGEADASSAIQSYLTNASIIGRIAQQVGGAVVAMEHRYFGTSSPYAELTTENLRYLTLKNSIADLIHFARNADLPFDRSGNSSAKNAPWMLFGGSYSAQLSAWTARASPGTFWAYHASSAAVEAIEDYWQYFVPIQEGMPQNCSRDVSLVIDHIDRVLFNGTASDKQQLKDKFGLGALAYDDDFGEALAIPIFQWQAHTFTTGYHRFFQFCDAVENVASPVDSNTPAVNRSAAIPDASGVGLPKALDGYAAWMRSYIPGYCRRDYGAVGYHDAGADTSCFDFHNASQPLYTDTSPANSNRTWRYLLCNEPLGFWFDGPPPGRPAIASRTLTVDHWRRKCPLYFPGWTPRPGASVAATNAFTGGWSASNVSRLLWVQSEFDPWRTGTVSSAFRPAGPLAGTTWQPVVDIPGGGHVPDFATANARANPGVGEAVEKIIGIMKGWADEYYEIKGKPRPYGGSGGI